MGVSCEFQKSYFFKISYVTRVLMAAFVIVTFKIIHIQILDQLFLSKSKIFGECYRREFSYFSSTKTSNHGRSNCVTSLTYINQFNCGNILYFIFSEKFFHKLINS